MKTENKILILTDFTQTCYDSVSYGLELCRFYGFGAEVLHVKTGNTPDKAQMDKTAEIVGLYNRKFSIGASLSVVEGTLTETVSQTAVPEKYLFVLLGTHGKSGFQNLTGSFAAKIITALKIPILVVQSRRFVPFDKTVLPFFSALSSVRNFDGILPLARIFNSEIDVVCRKKDAENAKCFIYNYLDDKIDKCTLTVLEASETGFVSQMTAYSAEHGAGMIFNFSSQSDNLQFSVIFEQLMFNVRQIPVMCKYL